MVLATDQFHALLVGVGDYESSDFPNLPVTVFDAEAVAAVLLDPDYCGYPEANMRTLLGEQAHIEAIRTALRNLARGSALAETIIVYFSGHGGQAYIDEAWQAYLCPRGANVSDLPGTAISATELSKALGAIAAKRLVVILDMCFAGGAAEPKSRLLAGRWKTGWSDDEYDVLSRGSGRVIIASSKEDQVSYVRRQGDMSVFTYHLVQALRGGAAIRDDGLIRVLDTYSYVSDAVQGDEPSQEPVLKAHNLAGNFPLALAARRPPAPEHPAPQPQRQPQHHETPAAASGDRPLIGKIHGDGNTINVADRMTVRIDQRKTGSSGDK